MVRDTVLYDRLEVKPDATEEEIKKEYKRLSKMWHPDKNPDKKEEATVKFQEISQAKEILLDSEKRKIYDQVGMNILKAGIDDEASGSPFSDFANMFGGFGGFPGFGNMPGFNMHQQNVRRKVRVDDIKDKIDVTLEQLYNGVSIPYAYKYKSTCGKCNEEGTKDGKTNNCNGCNGTGMRVVIQRQGSMVIQSQGLCNLCNGVGKVVNNTNKCDDCNGCGYVIKDRIFPIQLKSGLQNGAEIIIEGKGHRLKDGHSNLRIIVNVLKHNLFTRIGDSLVVELEIKLYQALFGFDKVIKHLDNRELHLSCTGHSTFNKIRKLMGEGMMKGKGNMYVIFKVDLPNLNNLPVETQAQLKQIIQSFNKEEVVNESNLKKKDNLIKTVMNDCSNDESNKILQILNNQNNEEEGGEHTDRGGQEQGCVQQ